ncbi:hypothetical protein R3P38DRAFT_3334080 [Favolaschia claudopus]|uniref:Uncharacterized protein n=1 Tax=Favolaschia claudopus TaxID=2862362 RepID=A0AAV9ZGA5_9AGAR
MPKAYTTIAQASAPPRRPDAPKKTAPLTTEQQKEKRDARNEKQAQIDAEVLKWMQETNELANKLADRFDLKPRYFLDIFFQGGAHMINHQTTTNPYNAFKSVKATEAREPRVQDVANVVRNMKMLMFGVGQRVGIEGFFVLVRNNVDFKMEPEWYFTSKELENYMEIVTRKKWSTSEVGMRLEAFAIAGCDPANMLRTTHQKVNFMKGEIRSILAKNLAEVSKVSDARLAWKWFEEDVVQRYDVVLEGWTTARIVDPSNISTSLSVVRTLLNAVKSEEAADRLKTWEEDHRAPRCDAGVPRKRGREDDEGSGDEEDQEGQNAAAGDGQEDGDENTDAGASNDPPPPKKQARKSTAGTKASKASKAPSANASSANSTVGKRRPGSGTKILRSSKKTSAENAGRDDETTRAALDRLKAARSRKNISSEVVDSGDEENTDPSANGGAVIVYNPLMTTA